MSAACGWPGRGVVMIWSVGVVCANLCHISAMLIGFAAEVQCNQSMFLDQYRWLSWLLLDTSGCMDDELGAGVMSL